MTEAIQRYLQDDIDLLLGEIWDETINFYEDNNDPTDTTDWEMTLEIRKSFPNGDQLDVLTTDGTRIINTPGSGQFNLLITKEQIAAYGWTMAEYRTTLDYAGTSKVIRMGKIRVV